MNKIWCHIVDVGGQKWAWAWLENRERQQYLK